MFSDFLKSLSILKKFLFINLITFLVIGIPTILYLGNVKPNLIKNKTTKHIQIMNNTIEHILRLDIKFEEEDIRKFLFSTRFLFQNLDRVILFDNQFNLVGDTDTLDLDPRSFSNRLNIVQLEILNAKNSKKIVETKNIDKDKDIQAISKDMQSLQRRKTAGQTASGLLKSSSNKLTLSLRQKDRFERDLLNEDMP